VIEWWWSWLLTGIGVFGLFLVTQKLWYGFVVALVAQVLWVTYAIVSDQLGFLVSAAAYGSVNAWGLYKWTRRSDEHQTQSVD
jgi:hypothetical protein